ncbi:hypothetical protein [Leptospira alstonii]|uniref:Uncharacterized protein n=2 Tax=Leptospira alstonii TaxID=28452 RepID=M6CRS1_9LEPT|nr:hypothetical protein [Leptospira alstonii]EMJ93236.1 hypothetical protein LEP1GSC194_1767 [Leptospira alstonii serovar Sichuan str. 79601]EQA78474.1 hypothetical protein LEP1GSC193_4113 [Leptospira alstonii serovar Pingchang str. 80-412]
MEPTNFIQKLQRIIYIFYSIIFNLGMALLLLIFIFGTIGELINIRKIIETEVPAYGVSFIALVFFGSLIYFGMRVKYLRYPYERAPVLAPLMCIAFIMFSATEIGLSIMNGWAHFNVIGKKTAIVLTTIFLISVRVGLSFWYSKYPIHSSQKED